MLITSFFMSFFIACLFYLQKFGDGKVDDLYGFSYQARQIMELMGTYTKMHYKAAKEKKVSKTCH